MTPEENDLLCRVEGDAPMGRIARSHWLPALLSEEVPEPDGTPVPVRLLGEDLVAFRDSDGRIGLVDEFCPHRRVSLWFGRNEECGLRCAYHGWKFDVEGNCVDQPDPAVAVPEADQVLAEQLDAHRRAVRLGDLPRQAGGYPIPPHRVAHRRAGVDTRDQFVFLRGQHRRFSSSLAGVLPIATAAKSVPRLLCLRIADFPPGGSGFATRHGRALTRPSSGIGTSPGQAQLHPAIGLRSLSVALDDDAPRDAAQRRARYAVTPLGRRPPRRPCGSLCSSSSTGLPSQMA